MLKTGKKNVTNTQEQRPAGLPGINVVISENRRINVRNRKKREADPIKCQCRTVQYCGDLSFHRTFPPAERISSA